MEKYIAKWENDDEWTVVHASSLSKAVRQLAIAESDDFGVENPSRETYYGTTVSERGLPSLNMAMTYEIDATGRILNSSLMTHKERKKQTELTVILEDRPTTPL